MLLIVVAYLLADAPHKHVLTMAVVLTIFSISFMSEEIALSFLIFSMLLSPEFGVRDTAGTGTTLRLDDFLLSIVCFTWLAKTAILKEPGAIFQSRLTKPIFLYLFICVLATALGIYSKHVYPRAGFFFVLKSIEYFMLFFMVANHVKNRKQIERFLSFLFLTCALVCIIAMIQIPGNGRMTAPFEGNSGEPNTLGGYLVFVLALICGLYLTAQFSAVMRIVFSCFMLLIFIVILATQSRGSWLALAIMYLTFMMFSNKRGLLFIILIIGLAGSPLFLPDFVRHRLSYTFKEEKGIASRNQEKIGGQTLDTSASARIRDWKAALKQIRKKPILGYGITGWRFIDSQYVRILLETGFLGLSCFLWLLATLFKLVIKQYRILTDSFYKGITLGFIAGFMGILAHALTSNTFMIVRIMEPFWFVTALIIMIPTIQRQENGSSGISTVGCRQLGAKFIIK